jgi:hypothetical protein
VEGATHLENRSVQRTIDGTIARARWRLRLQRAVERTATALVPASALALVFLLVYKRDLIEVGVLWVGIAAAGAIAVAGLLLGLLSPVPDVAAARAVDARADLADRLGSAWDFARAPERTPFMEAAIRDAARHAGGLRVGRLLKLTRPRDLPMAVALLAAVGLALAIPRTAAELPDLERIEPPKPPSMVPPFQAALAREKLEETRREAEKAREPEARKVLSQIDKLWKGIAERQFDKRELWRRIAALQNRTLQGLSAEDKAEMGRLRKMGEEMASASVTKELAGALKRSDLARAQEALRELSRRLKDRLLTRKQRRELEKALKQAARKTRRELESLRRKLDQLRKDLRKRELQRLTREKKQRELERLSREMDKLQSMLTTQLSQELLDALRQMKRYSDADAGRSLERAGQKLEELMKRIRRLQLLTRAQDHIREMKELLRRGDQGSRDDQLREFHLRAGNGQGDLTLLLPLGGNGQKPGNCSQCGGNHPTREHGPTGGERDRPGPGIGTGTDMRLGKPTEIDAKYRESRLTGKKGRGESTSEIFYGAATKGFSRVGYKNVYLRYREVVEEALEKNKAIPHGYKRLVEKYFEMIRPR